MSKLVVLEASRRVKFRSMLSSARPPLCRVMSPLLAITRLSVRVRSARPLLPMAPVFASRAV
ncbi:hypothetical protein D3C81_2205390 [compost metagenome]